MNPSRLAELVANYQPDQRILGGLESVHLLMVVGPTGAGKSTLIKASGIPLVVGDASRPPRSNEINGVDNWFRSLEDMLAEADTGQYIQLALGSEGDLKGTHAGNFPPSGPAAFTVAASAIDIFRNLPFASTVTTVIVPPDYDTWMQRISQHHTTPDKLAVRIIEAKKSYEFALSDEDSLFILNNNLEAATARLVEAANGGVPSCQVEARQIVVELLQKIA